MKETSIKTYDTSSFRTKYMQSEQQLNTLLKSDFGKFFIVRVEDLIRLIKLPVPPVRATNHTLIYLTEGEAVMSIGSETYTILKDECLIVPAGQVFSFSNLDINKGYLCHFHEDMIIGRFGNNELLNDFDFLKVWGNPRIPLSPEISNFVIPLFRRLLAEYAENGLAHSDIIQPYLMALLCEINRAYQPVAVPLPGSARYLVNHFKELLVTHIKTKHLVTDYASLLHITPNHLNKCVKAVTGKSTTQWIDNMIVLEAKVLLCQSHLSINEVATEIGLHDPSYFSRLFKKKEGITPSDFRRMIEKS
ncbi:MAG: AraC family transcriptional regulator [Spirosomataceae bacterium]